MFEGRLIGARMGALRAAAVAALLAQAVLFGADGREATIALVVETDSAVLLREGDRFPLPLVAGEILFPQDRLTVVKGAVRLVRCSADGRGQRLTLTAGTIIFGHDSDDRTQATITDAAETATCALPDAERLPAVSVLDSLRAGAADAGRDVKTSGAELPSKVANAVAHERNGRYAEAAEAYEEIARLWPEQQWSRRLALHTRARIPASKGEGKLYALLLGVSRYKEPPKQIRPLSYAHQDAELFGRFLEKSGRAADFAKNVQLEIRTNEAADWASIRTLLTTFFARAGANDTILLFIASHGVTYNQDGYIVVHDSKLQTLYDTGISMKMIRDTLAGVAPRVRGTFLFIDACHASRIGQIRDENTVDKQLRSAIGSVRDGEVFWLYAASGDQSAYEHERYGGGHGAFTYFLLRALNVSARDSDYALADSNRDAALSPNEVINYVLRSVLAATGDKQRPYGESRMKEWQLSLKADPYPMPCCNPLDKSRTGVPGVSRDTVGEPRGSDEWLDDATKRRMDLEGEAQRILLKYIEGDEIPQTRDDFARGAEVCTEAKRLAGDSVFLDARQQFFLGRTLIFDKKYPAAEEHLQRSIRMDPASPYPYNALGIAYLEQAQYDLAEAAFQDSIRRAPYWAYPRHNLALTRTQRGEYDLAVAEYREAMRLAPDYSYLPYNLGLLYQRMNRDDEAVAEFRRAEQRADWRATPAIALGVLEMSRGNNRRARRHFQRARALLDARPEADLLLTLRHNEALLLARDRNELPAAVKLWRENIAEADYLPSRFSLARALTAAATRGHRVDAGLSAEALKEWQAVVAEVPDNSGARLAWADLLIRTGDHGAARRVLEDGLGRRPDDASLVKALGKIEQP